MEAQRYKKQARLLLNILREVAKEDCFALHGGTAINLFVRDMPRLSVDIDLTYIPLEDRQTSLKHIGEALERIKSRIENLNFLRARVQHKQDIAKLLIASQGAEIKLEVNLTGRGIIAEPAKLILCDKAQAEFDTFAAMTVVPFGQLFGGKICAALDRQHPRDLYDVKYLLDLEGFSEEVRQGFIYCLLGSDRPIHELIRPNFQDQRSALDKQFSGMTDETFSYENYEEQRERLVRALHESLTLEDKAFLLGFKNVEPDWSVYDFERFPSVQWKLRNLANLKKINPEKHAEQYRQLKEKLG